MKYQEIFRQSPNISTSRIKPIGIVLHHTAGSYNGSVAWCLNPASKVSYHCIIDLNGNRTILAKDNQRAWHCGVSSFKGQRDCNSFMIGVAVSGDTSKRELTENEIESVALFCVDKMKLHNIPVENITTHAEISPGRKFDIIEKAKKQIIERIVLLLQNKTKV